MADWHLAQVNVARIVAPLDSPAMADFVAALDGINTLAEASPGFVWRLKGEGSNATDLRTDEGPDVIVNMSVWETVEALFEFVYRSAHTKVMVRRREWFQKPEQAYQVLWWVPAGHQPPVEEALARLDHLRKHGPTPHAFTFKQHYPPPGDPSGPTDLRPEPYCIGWA